MGFYIETKSYQAKGKAKYLHEFEGATLLLDPKFPENSNTILICVVDNGPFEAAGICYNRQEFMDFNEPDDPRPKVWLTLPRQKVIELCPPVEPMLWK